MEKLPGSGKPKSSDLSGDCVLVCQAWSLLCKCSSTRCRPLDCIPTPRTMNGHCLGQSPCETYSTVSRTEVLYAQNIRTRSLRNCTHVQQPYVRQSRSRAAALACRGRVSISAQQTQTELSIARQTEDVYQVSLRTSEARKSLRFTQAKDGRIVIEAVAIGSEAEQVTFPCSSEGWQLEDI